jgi:hypothetical protein
MQPEKEIDYNKPVAYTPDGQPLYARPSGATVAQTASESGSQPQVVYLSRAIDPHQQTISPELQQKHDESVRHFPQLGLSEGEYVISAVRRHPIGVVSIWLVVALAITLLGVVSYLITTTDVFSFFGQTDMTASAGMVVILSSVLLIVGGIAATFIYDANRFFLTNESVIQYIQTSLFARKNQTISLGNVEDASFSQDGIIQTLLNYGSIRLSTEGDETTYRFAFVADPKNQIHLINDAIEAFKNFRPIDSDES